MGARVTTRTRAHNSINILSVRPRLVTPWKLISESAGSGRVRAILPTGRQSSKQKGEWLRSPVALAPSYARHYLVGGVHPDRGRYLAHDPDWRMSAATGPWRRCNLTERQESRGQRFAPAVRERSLGTDRGARPRVRPLRRRSAKIRSKATHGPAKVLVPQGESSLS